MFRVTALAATVAVAGSLAGTASAHPPDINDAYYGTTYTQPYHGTTYTQPYTSTRPYYGTSSYSAPTYSAPTYTTTYNAAPIYTKTYATPSYSYSGYSSPSYGYRHRGGHGYYGYVRNERRRPYDGHLSYGPYSDVPTTEGFNVGYSGGPTFGNDHMPVINGVRVGNNPNH